MTVTNIKCDWIAGNLNFKDVNGNIIATWEGINRKLTFPSGSTLNIATGGIVTVDGENISTELKALSNLDAELALLEGITASAAEINLIDGSIAGTAVASKALALGANKNIDTIVIADSGLKLGAGAGAAVTMTAAQINLLTQGIAGGYKTARGTITPTTASDTVVTGLTTVVAVVASLKGAPTLTCMFVAADIGNQAGAPAAGSILIKSYKPTAAADVTPLASTTPWSAIDWIAIGT